MLPPKHQSLHQGPTDIPNIKDTGENTNPTLYGPLKTSPDLKVLS